MEWINPAHRKLLVNTVMNFLISQEAVNTFTKRATAGVATVS
jgi:hypothetical protein